MPTREEMNRRRTAAVRRRRRFRHALVWVAAFAVAAAAVGVTVKLVNNRKGQLTPEEVTSSTASGVEMSGATSGTENVGEAETTVSTETPTTSGVSEPSAEKTTPSTAPAATTAQPSSTYTPNTAGHYVQKGEPAWNLRLVNEWNPLPADYDYEGHLTTYSGSKKFDERAIDALRRMIDAGSAYNLSAASLFRSYDLQVSLFNRQVAAAKAQGYTGAAAEAKAATVVTRPGTSEHHTGLTVDVLGSGYSSLEQSFENTPAFAWLKAHCAEYGFILRYPKEKEDITGIIYEPWHYRYVGVEAATEIMSRGLSLEEYLEEKGL